MLMEKINALFFRYDIMITRSFMKKSIFSFLSISLFSVFMISCTEKKAAKPVTLIMAEVNPESSLCGQMDLAFKEKVEELSNGSIIVDLRCSGVLGDESQILKQMFDKDDNSIQLARVSANLSSYGATKSKLINIPYTFSNSEHFWTFATSDLAKEILTEPYTKNLGVRGLCYAEEGFRNFFMTQKLTKVEDFQGKKMRVSGQILTSLADSLQAEPVKIPFTDLFLAMQTGQVEVADQPISNYLSNSLYKAAPYMIQDGHMLGGVQIIISSAAWDSLTEKQQQIIEESALYAANILRIKGEEFEQKAISQMQAEGVEFIPVKDIDSWRKASKKVITELSKDYPEIYQQILDMNK